VTNLQFFHKPHYYLCFEHVDRAMDCSADRGTSMLAAIGRSRSSLLYTKENLISTEISVSNKQLN